MMKQILTTAQKLRGVISVPGDKSISHRALICGALSRGTTIIRNLSDGQDVESTRTCLADLGIRFSVNDNTITVHGKGLNGLNKPSRILDAGNSGTTMRLLSGVLAAQPFDSNITGDMYLRKRPMIRIIKPLTQMGAEISTGGNGQAPLHFNGGSLHPIRHISTIASAQVKSCILFGGLYAKGATSVEEPSLSRDHTERMLPCFGVPVTREGLKVSIRGPANLSATNIDVPGDLSSAAFFLIASAIVPDSEITILNVGTNPTRTGILDCLKEMGAAFQMKNHHDKNGEPRSDIRIASGRLQGIPIDKGMIPRLIDEIPVLAVAATQAHGKTRILNASELRVKETDRIHAVVDNLRRMGAAVTEFDDGMEIVGPQKLAGAEVDSFGDHRITMAFAVAGLVAKGETVIRGTESVNISFPSFFTLLKELVHA